MNGLANPAPDLSRIKYELELFLLGSEFDLYEDGKLVSTVGQGHAGADISYGKMILSCWGDNWSRSWRVLACATLDDHVRLHCTKQMGRTHCVLDLRRGESTIETLSAQHARCGFASRLEALIESNFENCAVEQSTTARDDRRHLSGNYARFVLNNGGETIASIGADDLGPQPVIDAMLGAALIWLDDLRHRKSSVKRLMIFAPKGKATNIATRMTAVHVPGASISLYEVDYTNGKIKLVAAFDQGDLSDHLRRSAMHALWPRERDESPAVSALVDSIVRLAPSLIETTRRAGRIKFSIRGLEFARVSAARLHAEFGLGPARKSLSAANHLELARLVREITSYRRAECEDRNNLIFRAQPERWLESIIRADVTAIDPALDPRFAYSQVPAYRGEQRAFIDLLAVSRSGRLAVIELKVSEDAEFPFQGLDYWLRVEWHRARRDFKRRGFFQGVEIADEPAMLYLVAPLFRFHATTKLIAGSISERVPVYRIGINEDWRAGVRVLLSERLN